MTSMAGAGPDAVPAWVPCASCPSLLPSLWPPSAAVGRMSLKTRLARDIAQTGNTSAASIPLATERLQREGAYKSGAIALQIGFGAGLAYAAQVVTLP